MFADVWVGKKRIMTAELENVVFIKSRGREAWYQFMHEGFCLHAPQTATKYFGSKK